MKNAFLAASAILALGTPLAFADTQWSANFPTPGSWATPANWTNNVPSPTSTAYFVNNSPFQHHLQLFGTTQTLFGFYFGSGSGTVGFFIDEGGTASQFNLRAGGTANGIFNGDGYAQTFDVPIAMFSQNGFAGSLAAQTWNAAGGGLIFSGIYSASSATINNNGGRLSFDGTFNITIGNTNLDGSGATGRGDIVGTGGLTKSGSGTLRLGGNTANSYSGTTIVNAGTLLAGKANALGSSSQLQMNGGTFRVTGPLGTSGQTNGSTTLNIQGGPGTVFMDFGNGGNTNYISFANSSGVSWAANGELDILNWNS